MKQDNEKFMQMTEMAIEMGKTIIIEQITDEISLNL